MMDLGMLGGKEVIGEERGEGGRVEEEGVGAEGSKGKLALTREE
jgi:hypothetical protein